MAISNLQTSITNIKSRLYNIQGKLNELVAGVSTDEYADFEIPSNYTLLEYIQANGNCWCNSGYIPKSDTTIYGKFYMASQSSSYPTIFGARNGSPFTLSWYSHNMTDGWAWIRNNVSSTRTGQTKFQNTLVYLDSTENYKTMKFLNEFKEEVGSLTWGNLPTDSRIQHSLYLFVLNNDGSVDGATYCSGYRIHYIKFYENGELVRGYCACLDGNGTPCFYDTVTQTTYYNQGSGSFIAGPEHVRPTPTLPYRELEYIESTGTQYINTMYNPSSKMKYELKITNSSVNGVLFGAYNTTWTDGNGLYTNVGGGNKHWLHYYSNTETSHWSTADEEIVMNKGNLMINGVTVASLSDKTFTVNYPLYIFAGNMHGGIEQRTKYRLHYFKIYDNGTLVKDLIPVQRKLDNVICLYDKISKTYLENAGTGTFIAGPEKQNKPYIELEYIKFTGSQSLNFNYNLWETDNWKIDWKMLLSDLHDYQALFSITTGDSASPNETWVYANNKLAIRFNNNKQETHSLSANTIYTCQLYRSGTSVSTVVNNSSHSYNYGISNLSGSLRFGNTPTSTRRFTGNIYYIQFYSNNNVVRTFIPVKRKSDDVVCFYDTKTQTYLENAGTGTFVAGPEV